MRLLPTRPLTAVVSVAMALLLTTTAIVGTTATPASAKQDGCATVYSSDYVKSILGQNLARTRAHAYWCDSGNTITLWDAYGSQKTYQHWSFHSWLAYENTAASTSSYRRSWYDAKYQGATIPGVITDYATADRGLKAYASTGTVNGYG